MAEENINKKTGAERQAEVLVAALERANKNGGTLLNAWQKAMPQFYDKTLRITPVNALIMAMHSDNGEFKTNSYTMFNETHDTVRPLRKDRKESLSFGRTSTSTSTKTMRRIKSAVQNTILSQMQKKQNTRLILVRMCIRSSTSIKPPCPMFIRKNMPSRWSSLDQTDRQMKSSFEWMSTNSSRV